MSYAAFAIAAICLATVVGTIVAAFFLRSYVVQIVVAVLLLPLILFCLFGFAATFEPMPPRTQWVFRIGYAAVGFGLTVTVVALLIKRPVKSSNHTTEQP